MTNQECVSVNSRLLFEAVLFDSAEKALRTNSKIA